MLVNARMYSISPAAKAAWQQLYGWVMARAGVSWTFIDHAPPLLLSELWSREDLGLVQMCGLPFARRRPPAVALVAPVPSLPQYGGRSVYFSYLAVRADAPYERLEDTFGRVAGYTLKDSQSGYFAFRHHLLEQFGRDDQHAAIVGGLLNPRGVIQALADGRIDVGPLDSYVFDLIRATDPAFAAQVKIIATTDPTPMPPVTCSASVPPDVVSALREAFAASMAEPGLREALQTLCIAGFIVPDPASFGLQDRRATRVEAAGEWP
jgi:ABC-type phosphate/phosphonate transport system substrate-binding protein